MSLIKFPRAPLRGNILAHGYFNLYSPKFLISGCTLRDGPTPREGTLRRKEICSKDFLQIRGMPEVSSFNPTILSSTAKLRFANIQ